MNVYYHYLRFTMLHLSMGKINQAIWKFPERNISQSVNILKTCVYDKAVNIHYINLIYFLLIIDIQGQTTKQNTNVEMKV